MNSKRHVLFLCTGNSARSILGEALLNELGGDRFKGHSAGSNPTGTPNPYAISLLEEKGFDTRFARSKSWDEFEGADAPLMDLIVTVCDSAANETCPYFPGSVERVHWGMPDPAGLSGVEESKRAFLRTYEQLSERIETLLHLDKQGLDRVRFIQALRELGSIAS